MDGTCLLTLFLISFRVTAVTGFVFLRFFVPALLDPCEYGLCQPWQLRFQERTTLFNLGVILQKMANLVTFTPGSNNFHLLNNSLQLGSFIIYQWVSALCYVEIRKLLSRSVILILLAPAPQSLTGARSPSDTLSYNAVLLARFYTDRANSCEKLPSSDKAKEFLETAFQLILGLEL
jgi:hypothetical protein